MAEYKGNNNLVGKKFNKLTVLEYLGESYWLCQCECGNTSKVRTANLTTGKTKSCGCLRGQATKGSTRNMGPRKDITGQKFGSLTAMYYIKGGKWHCKCDCGNETDVDTRNLNSGHTTSCGCKLKHNGDHLVTDMLGFESDGVKVLERAGSDDQKIALWKCECKYCGNIFIARGSHLRDESVRSCGCINSHNEQKIIKMLIENNILFKTQYTFPDLKSSKNKTLRFDFAIFNEDGSLSHLIEYNGKQHYEKVNGKWGEDFENAQERDSLKIQYCKDNNIELRIIPYYQKYELKDLI